MKQLTAFAISLLVCIPAFAQNTSSKEEYSNCSAEDMEKYPTVNLLNSFTGVLPGLHVTENSGATGVRYNNDYISLFSRGFNITKYVVDGVLVEQLSEFQLSPQELDSAHLLNDIVSKVKFGPSIARGAIYLNTAKGLQSGRRITAGFECGVDAVDRFPEFVGGWDYAMLNNQARINTGRPVKFTDENLEGLKLANPMDMVNPNVNWRDMVLKTIRPLGKAYVTIKGGEKRLRYYGSLTYAGQGDMYKVCKEAGYHRINAKMNMDVDINDYFNISFDFIGGLTIRNSPYTGYRERSTTDFTTILKRLNNYPSTIYPLYLDVDPVTNVRNYQTSSDYTVHPYASVAETGYYTETSRSALVDAKINYDFRSFAPGLKAQAMVSYNIYYLAVAGQSKDYLSWFVDEEGNRTQTTHQGQADSEKQANGTGYLQDIQFHAKLFWDRTFGNHDIHVGGTYYRGKSAVSTSDNYHIQQNFILDANYSFAKRYNLELAVNTAGTSALKPGKRYAAFPAVGLSWVLTNEKFMQNCKALKYFKLRAQAGIIGVETFSDQYLWRSLYEKGGNISFGPYSNGNHWLGSENKSVATSTTVVRYANEDLGWEKMYELTAGFDARIGKGFNIGFTYFNTLRDGVVTDISALLPMFYGVASVYANNNRYRYFGEEINLGYTGRSGDFQYRVGAFLTLPQNILLKNSTNASYDAVDPVGKSTGAIFGYECIGKFQTVDEISSSPTQTIGSDVQPGDLKYQDLNNDGKIDANDRHQIGDSSPKLLYAVNVNLRYKGFEVTVVGTGKAFFDIMQTNSYFWNGWKDTNYSVFVRDNIGGAYPRLSYDKIDNNFTNSTFWKADGSFFKIQNVELAYNFSFRKGNVLGINGLKVFARGANLCTLSAIKDVDPESIEAGVTLHPLFRTFTGGIKMTF